jgi:hypothetical protein
LRPAPVSAEPLTRSGFVRCSTPWRRPLGPPSPPSVLFYSGQQPHLRPPVMKVQQPYTLLGRRQSSFCRPFLFIIHPPLPMTPLIPMSPAALRPLPSALSPCPVPMPCRGLPRPGIESWKIRAPAAPRPLPSALSWPLFPSVGR